MPAAVPVVAGEALLAGEVMAAEAAAAAAAEAAAVEAASVAAAEAASQAAATAAAEQAATAAATEAATAGAQAATTGAADLATQEAIRAQLAANAGQVGLPSITPQLSPLQPTGIQSLSGVQNVAVPESALAPQQTPNFVEAVTNAPVAEAPSAPSNPLYELQAPGYQGVNAPVDTTVPGQYSLSSQNYNLAQPVSSGAATQTAGGTPNMFDKALDYIKDNKLSSASMGLNALNLMNKKSPEEPKKYKGSLSKFSFNPDVYEPYEPRPPSPLYTAQYPTYAAGGLSSLGGYSDYAGGGRMLKGPGDGMSDNIPATIAGKQPARLANEEFVVPADVVSHLGNGSSEAGAKALYKMMDRVRQARTGTKKQGKQINPEKYLA
jgi:hypothetical protein